MSLSVHQFHPTVSYGDAISNHILDIQHILRRLGHHSEIFCEHPPTHFEGRARRISRFERYSSPENVLLLHFSLGYSPEVMNWLEQIPDRKILVYHNITPSVYFEGINDVYLAAARKGRQQLDHLRALTEAGWGVSHFNCRELAARGWNELGVLPIVFRPERYGIRPDRKVLRRWRAGTNILFVGRVSPNKCFEDVILTFYYFKRFIEPEARLFLVGSAKGLEIYLEFLQALMERLGLADVFFTGHVSNAQLMAHYRCASVYLSMSEHEGFGVPLLESMHFDVPVVAYKAAAIPETLDGSGVLVKEKDHMAVAELMGVLLERENLRSRIVARQRERLQDFSSKGLERALRSLLRGISGGQV